MKTFPVTIGAVTVQVECELVTDMAEAVKRIEKKVGELKPQPQLKITIGPVETK